MNKAYTRIDWENEPSTNTPINETNLNKMDYAIDELDNRVIAQDVEKATKIEVSTLVADVDFDENTGIITVTRKNGSSFTIDTKLEKIAINFTYDKDAQQIILTLIDGTKQYIDLSALITQYEFLDSDTITFVVQSDGKIKAEVLDGSITENKLQSNYLAQIKVETAKSETYMNNASSSATQAKSYAVGGTGTRTGEDTDNAKYYYQQAKSTDVGQLRQDVDEINRNLVVLGKCKNLLNPTLETTTQNGVTCTNNGDGTYTLNGTSSAQTTFILKTINDLPTGKYILLSNSIYISAYLLKSDGTWVKTLSGGDIFEITSTNSKIRVVIFVGSGKTFSNEIVKPMVTTNLNATADDFVPYTGDGDTLTSDVAGIKNDLDKLNSLPVGTVLQLETDKDIIQTTTEKYGWQYLGTSNIQYDNGAMLIIETNVYRKNS